MHLIPSPPGWFAHTDSGEVGTVVAWRLDEESDMDTLVPMVLWPHQVSAVAATRALGEVRLVGPGA